MKSRIFLLLALIAVFFVIAFLNANFLLEDKITGDPKVKTQIKKTDKEWKEILTPEQYKILRQSGTERPFMGKYTMFFEDGIYSCAACRALTGERYGINSVALDFKPAEAEKRTQEAIATFAAGCFWGVEHNFRQIEGVLSTLL